MDLVTKISLILFNLLISWKERSNNLLSSESLTGFTKKLSLDIKLSNLLIIFNMPKLITSYS